MAELAGESVELQSEAIAYWRGASPRRVSTSMRYEASVRRLSRFGLLSTSDVTRDRIVVAQRALLAQGWSVSSVRTEFAALRSVLAQLARDRLFSKEILRELREAAISPAPRGRRLRARFLTRPEVARLAGTARIVEPRLELPILAAAWSGARLGELARLRAEDIKGHHLWIESMPEYGEAGSCKTGPRRIPICRELAAVLDRCPSSGWLFPSAHQSRRLGRPPRTPFLSRWTLETGLARVRTVARIGDATFTVLRHTRASWWIQANVSLTKAADWLGHDPMTCARFYLGLSDDFDPDCERAPAA